MHDSYIVYELDAGPEDVIEVTLSGPANVMLLTQSDYLHYQNNEEYSYIGGFSDNKLTVTLTPPHQGHWYLVVDLGGYPGHVNASMKIVSKERG